MRIRVQQNKLNNIRRNIRDPSYSPEAIEEMFNRDLYILREKEDSFLFLEKEKENLFELIISNGYRYNGEDKEFVRTNLEYIRKEF